MVESQNWEAGPRRLSAAGEAKPFPRVPFHGSRSKPGSSGREFLIFRAAARAVNGRTGLLLESNQREPNQRSKPPVAAARSGVNGGVFVSAWRGPLKQDDVFSRSGSGAWIIPLKETLRPAFLMANSLCCAIGLGEWVELPGARAPCSVWKEQGPSCCQISVGHGELHALCLPAKTGLELPGCARCPACAASVGILNASILLPPWEAPLTLDQYSPVGHPRSSQVTILLREGCFLRWLQHSHETSVADHPPMKCHHCSLCHFNCSLCHFNCSITGSPWKMHPEKTVGLKPCVCLAFPSVSKEGQRKDNGRSSAAAKHRLEPAVSLRQHKHDILLALRGAKKNSSNRFQVKNYIRIQMKAYTSLQGTTNSKSVYVKHKHNSPKII
ncbi:uncharacterized protein LOC142364062 [Opisthocomus hoazin]|uniref:uncharacterized protein LOC142364062 n=1 Tax=Opisthocomus hoazin TaxID=30419 RepID=UPI003F537E20